MREVGKHHRVFCFDWRFRVWKGPARVVLAGAVLGNHTTCATPATLWTALYQDASGRAEGRVSGSHHRAWPARTHPASVINLGGLQIVVVRSSEVVDGDDKNGPQKVELGLDGSGGQTGRVPQ